MTKLRLLLFSSSLFSCASVGVYVVIGEVVSTEDIDDKVLMRVVTANIPISIGINLGSTTRFPHIVQTVKSLYERNDVVCLQEVWDYNDSVRLVRELGISPDKAYFADTRGMGETGKNYCDSGLSSLRICVEKRCEDIPEEDRAICARERCGVTLALLFLFDRDCADCLVSMVDKPLREIVDTCSHPPGKTKIYDGGNGVILLSKHGIKNVRFELLPASSVNRVLLFGEVKALNFPKVDVICTHLSSEEMFAPTYTSFNTWDEERYAQLSIIMNRVSSLGKDKTVLLIGDLNFGPSDYQSITGFSEQVWRYSQKLGFISPVASTIPLNCSFCAGNTLRFDRDGGSFLVDHIMYHPRYNFGGLKPVFARTMVLPQVEICVREKNGVCREKRFVHLSDHLPVQVGFTVTSSVNK